MQSGKWGGGAREDSSMCPAILYVSGCPNQRKSQDFSAGIYFSYGTRFLIIR
jgi:hypothetical protein